MQKINYDVMRDDQIHYWLQYLKNDASEELRDKHIAEVAHYAFKRGLIGEKWLEYYLGNKELKPWQEWND